MNTIIDRKSTFFRELVASGLADKGSNPLPPAEKHPIFGVFLYL
jgi:hypothetical protein